MMIVRSWSGRTPAAKSEAYFEFLRTKGIRDILATPGNRGVQILRRNLGDETEFLLLSFWESEAAIRAFAGDRMDKAVYYPEDQDFLLNFSPTVDHYEIMHEAGR